MIAILAFILVWAFYTVVALLAIPWTLTKVIIRGVKQRSLKVYWDTMLDWGKMSSWGLDQAASPLIRHIGNDWLIKKDGVRIGSPDKTLSYYLGINKINGTLTFLGKLVAASVDFVSLLFFNDIDHTTKAAKAEQFND